MFKTVNEFLALTGPDAPTSAERALIEACRAGEVCMLSQTRPTSGTDANTIRASLLRLLILGGTPDCGLHARGVWVEGAWITATLDLAYCTALGQTVLNQCHFNEEPRFPSAKLNLLSFEGSHLPGFFGQGMAVTGSVFLSDLTATGTVDVGAAMIGGQLACTNATLNGAGGDALNAQGMETGRDLFLRDLTATGTIDMGGAKIGGQLSCTSATLDGAGGMALNAQGVETGQDLFLRNLTTTGTVDVNGAKIGGQLDCIGATLNGAGGVALNAQGVQTGQDMFLRNLTAMGMVDVNGAKIGGQLDCDGATLNSAGKTALHAQRMVVSAGFLFRNLKPVQGQIDLTAADVSDLVDDMASWPKGVDDLILDGFTYDRIDKLVTLSARSEWLKLGSSFESDFFPQPYTQFARAIHNMGHTNEARKVLYERDCRLFAEAEKADRIAYSDARDGDQSKHSDMGPIWCRLHLRRAWSLLSRIAIGHGHKPERALGCITFLTAIACLFSWFAWLEGSFAPNSDVILTSPAWTEIAAQGCVVAKESGCLQNPAATWSAKNAPGMDWDSFNALAYAADLVVPLIDLGQTSAWAPSKDRGWWGTFMWWGRWLFIIAGWVVASLGLAAVTGFVQKNALE